MRVKLVNGRWDPIIIYGKVNLTPICGRTKMKKRDFYSRTEGYLVLLTNNLFLVDIFNYFTPFTTLISQ